VLVPCDGEEVHARELGGEGNTTGRASLRFGRDPDVGIADEEEVRLVLERPLVRGVIVVVDRSVVVAAVALM